MRRIIGAAFQSLDGVIQAPGTPHEDPTGGFELGGWLHDYYDEAVGRHVEALFDGDFDLLLGRRTYEIFAAYWPFVKGEAKAMGEALDRAGKYVLTRGPQPLSWENSHRVKSLGALADFKRTDGPDLVIQGSSTLYPQLLAAGLLDRLTLMTFPLVLGGGKRLFGEGTKPGALRMVAHEVTAGGNIIATYEPNGEVKPGTFDATDAPSAAELERQARMAAGTW